MPFAIHHYRFRSLDAAGKKAGEKFSSYYSFRRGVKTENESARMEYMTNRLDVYDPFMVSRLGVEFSDGVCGYTAS
jgi:hypothetical protein